MKRRNFLEQLTAGGAAAAAAGIAASPLPVAAQIQVPTSPSRMRAAEFGAVGNGIADDTPAIQRAIDQAHRMGGGTVHLEGTAGRNFRCAGQLNLDGRQLVRLTASAGPTAAESVRIIYTGKAAPFISLRSSYAITFDSLNISYDHPQFDGPLIATGHKSGPADSTYLAFENCLFSGRVGTKGREQLLDLSFSIVSTIRSCEFVGASVAITRPGNTYSNAIQIHDSTFRLQSYAAIQNAGEAWLVSGCTFEPLFDGRAGALKQELGAVAWGLTLIGCWMGDVSAPGGCWIDMKGYAHGLNLIGNRIQAAGTRPGDTAVRFAHGNHAVHIAGNRMEGPTCIDFTTGNTFGASIISNDLQGTVPIANLEKAIPHFVAGQYTTDNYVSGTSHFDRATFNSDGVRGSIRFNTLPTPTKPEEGDMWLARDGLYLRVNGRNRRVVLE